jgi:hypothetical protein
MKLLHLRFLKVAVVDCLSVVTEAVLVMMYVGMSI